MFSEGSILYMVMQGTFLSHLVLLVLILMSISSLAIIGWKVTFLRQIKKDSEVFRRKYSTSDFKSEDTKKESSSSLQGSEVKELKKEWKNLKDKDFNTSHLAEKLERSLDYIIERDAQVFEKGVSVLASISSSAPFIGLLGTVMGIINSFHDIGQKGATSLAVVAPGISEALVATAFGLFAAIPALLGYNFLRNEIRKIRNELRIFGIQLINQL